MTQTWGPPPQPSAAPPSQTPPAPPRKKRSTGQWILLVIVGLFVIGGISNALDNDGSGQEAAKPVATNAQGPIEPVATEPAAPIFAIPKPRDFTLTVKVLEKANFGSAGSNITYRIEAGWKGTYDPDKTYEIIYEVRGGEDGPAINTMTVTGDEYERESEEFISTGSVGQKLTARVISVDEM